MVVGCSSEVAALWLVGLVGSRSSVLLALLFILYSSLRYRGPRTNNNSTTQRKHTNSNDGSTRGRGSSIHERFKRTRERVEIDSVIFSSWVLAGALRTVRYFRFRFRSMYGGTGMGDIKSTAARVRLFACGLPENNLQGLALV